MTTAREASSVRSRPAASRLQASVVAVGALALALLLASLAVVEGGFASAQSSVRGVVDPETAGVYLYTAGSNSGQLPECLGAAGGEITDDIVASVGRTGSFELLGDVDGELLAIVSGGQTKLRIRPRSTPPVVRRRRV